MHESGNGDLGAALAWPTSSPEQLDVEIGLDDDWHATARLHVFVAGSIYTLDTMHSLQRLSLGRLRAGTRLEGARQGDKCRTLMGFRRLSRLSPTHKKRHGLIGLSAWIPSTGQKKVEISFLFCPFENMMHTSLSRVRRSSVHRPHMRAYTTLNRMCTHGHTYEFWSVGTYSSVPGDTQHDRVQCF